LAPQKPEDVEVLLGEPALFRQNQRRNAVAVVGCGVAGVVDAHVQLGYLLIDAGEVERDGANGLDHRRGRRVVDGVVHLYPTAVRYTGCSITFSMAGILGASLAPYIATWLATTHGLQFVGYYLTASAAVTFVGLLLIRETRGENL
jgi:hypothetical protein